MGTSKIYPIQIFFVIIFQNYPFSQAIPNVGFAPSRAPSYKITFREIVSIGSSCSGYRFPGTNYIWTLKECILNPKPDSLNEIIIISQELANFNNSSIIKRDTFKQSKTIYSKEDWIIIEILNLVETKKDSNLIYLDYNNDEVVIGYPRTTDYNASSLKNYFDWIMIPQWQFQFDTFLLGLSTKENVNKLNNLINPSNLNNKKLIQDHQTTLVNIKTIEPNIFKDYYENEAISFCKKLWTDNQYVRNRITLLSSLSKDSITNKKIDELYNKENKSLEINGLATRLFITFKLLPEHLIPTLASDLILSFEKNYVEAAKFLINQPDYLIQIGLSLRNLNQKDLEEKGIYPKSEQREKYFGNGDLQIVSFEKSELDGISLYWKAFGLGGGVVCENGKIKGIHRFIPFYFARKFNLGKQIDYIPLEELYELKEEKSGLNIWKKISGFIEK